MKRKSYYHAEATEILNKPGRFVVIRQWVAGGATTADDNKGQGFDATEAAALCAQHNSLQKGQR